LHNNYANNCQKAYKNYCIKSIKLHNEVDITKKVVYKFTVNMSLTIIKI
jgi:hypothetical protein